MARLTILRNLLSGVWLINKEAGESYMPAVLQYITGETVEAFETPAEEEISPFALPIDAFQARSRVASDFSSTENIPEGSIAIIPIHGALMKEDYCGDPGTATMGQWIRNADANENIIGIILDIDSPGGHVDGTESLANTVSATAKPIVTLVDGMMASAAYWIGSAADHIILKNKTDLVGSIGTRITLADYKGYYEKYGIKVHDITADKSSDKIRLVQKVMEGDYQPMKTELLNPMNEVFLNAVIEQREGALQISDKTNEPLTGKVYLADRAIELGLADEMGELSAAIAKVKEISGTTAINSISYTEMTVQQIAKSIFGIASKQKKGEAVTAEDVEAINAELQAQGITGVVLVDAESHSAATEQLESLQEVVSTTVRYFEPEASDEEVSEFDLSEAITGLQQELEDAQAETGRLEQENETLSNSIGKPRKPRAKSTKSEIQTKPEQPDYYSEADAELDAMLEQVNKKSK